MATIRKGFILTDTITDPATGAELTGMFVRVSHFGGNHGVGEGCNMEMHLRYYKDEATFDTDSANHIIWMARKHGQVEFTMTNELFNDASQPASHQIHRMAKLRMEQSEENGGFGWTLTNVSYTV